MYETIIHHKQNLSGYCVICRIYEYNGPCNCFINMFIEFE